MIRGRDAGANVGHFFHVLTILGVTLWIGMFLVSRLHMLHASYSVLENERENDIWLVEQCKLHEFYHNMKHHSSLCDSVQKKQGEILLLLAMQRVIDETYLCGYESCGTLLMKVGDYMLGRGDPRSPTKHGWAVGRKWEHPKGPRGEGSPPLGRKKLHWPKEWEGKGER